MQDEPHIPLPLKIGIGGLLGIGAVATGFIATRTGRRMLGEAIQGRRRSTIEDRVLNTLWADRALGRRPIDVEETTDGTVRLFGSVQSDGERARAIELSERVKGVRAVVGELEVEPKPAATHGASDWARRLRPRGMI